jgi:hypothetical protein
MTFTYGTRVLEYSCTEYSYSKLKSDLKTTVQPWHLFICLATPSPTDLFFRNGTINEDIENKKLHSTRVLYAVLL